MAAIQTAAPSESLYPLAEILMQHFLISVAIVITVFLYSCNNPKTVAANAWTTEIRTKIIEEASQPYDEVILDSARSELIFLKRGKKLKHYNLRPSFDQEDKISSFDTASTIFYSADQKFELVRELCPVVERSFEGVRYNGYWVGKLEYRYCNGKPKKVIYSYNESIGVEKEYDSTGKIIKEIDHGKAEEFERLIVIKYHR